MLFPCVRILFEQYGKFRFIELSGTHPSWPPLTRGLSPQATGGEKNHRYSTKNEEISNIFSPSVSFADSSLVRGSLLGALLNCSINREFIGESALHLQVCHSERSVSGVEESTHFQRCLAVFRCEDPSTSLGMTGAFEDLKQPDKLEFIVLSSSAIRQPPRR